jgi:TPP-dependent indolepyruvate ferredoxin oxidoreductase alpha subunit
MNKRTSQAFAFGILFSAISLWIGSSVIADKERTPEITVSNAKELLETKGYTVMSSDEFSKLAPKKEEKIADKMAEAPAEKAKTEEVKQEEKKATLVIAGGMSPGDVALMLKSQGIIDDESKFERYLIDQGFHTKVQIGTYELTNSMDYYQIAKVITKNR